MWSLRIRLWSSHLAARNFTHSLLFLYFVITFFQRKRKGERLIELTICSTRPEVYLYSYSTSCFQLLGYLLFWEQLIFLFICCLFHFILLKGIIVYIHVSFYCVFFHIITYKYLLFHIFTFLKPSLNYVYPHICPLYLQIGVNNEVMNTVKNYKL